MSLKKIMKELKEELPESSYRSLDILISYGSFDGSHHKMWAIDQAVRVLAGDKYDDLIKSYRGKYIKSLDCYEYEWDQGIPP